ncbi:MAG: hypothetical protein CBC55_05225 [Gammaproteobacteria bacterium TMED95]|uniref:non-specific protein-tyrosine kinase n=1 Tax=Alteromonas mediterranea TaxID=314275 RepID=A0AAC9JEQ5_9ALTE|nr:AAA family ATPase [Alteromonas mediterranea]APD92410.1 hypothetical protein BM524_21145 [Alteromonas mediterranea]APE00271.1 hypothetical protein BM525_21365 [Alteromonas mediterranea]OUV22197.1 MAG: hypothetical protein CBC55_05225 [Gammaproteobacteria bacterium TMED95]|tara:strand:- start:9831 stop:10619 length:789 start_codon:yes stop_codon:yes gene_type:complete
MDNLHKPKLRFTDPKGITKIGETDNLSIAVREEFRSIKREILKCAFHAESLAEQSDILLEPKNRIMVTSITDQAGKTFISYNLAKSISDEQDKNILLVDADVINSTLSKTTEPQPNEGLIDYLSYSDADISERIYHTDRENMRFMPTGQDHFLANELFSSDKMTVLMDEFRDRYPDRLVIFDAPSLLDVNESVSLSEHMDQIIIIVEEGKTKERDIKTVLSRLPKGIRVHFILNKTLHGNEWRGHRREAPQDSGSHGSNAFL